MELGLIVVIAGILYKVADSDRQASPIIWAIISIVISIACLAIPLPYLRMIVALAICIGVWITTKAFRNR
jgi:multidrug transporter EmrE-like cation transporter